MQDQILLFFHGFLNGSVDKVIELITMLGEEVVAVCFVAIMYWCIDKKKAISSCVLLLSSLTITCVIKAIVRYPRPFTVIKDLDATRVETATGYSFPSGHTTSASSIYTSLAIFFKKRWLTVLCAIIILLVGLSRMCLAVHWPMDVLVGWIIGIGFTLAFANKFYEVFCDKERSNKFCISYSLIMGIPGLILAILLSLDMVDKMAFEDIMLFCIFGYSTVLGYYLEGKQTDFSTKGSILNKVLRVLIGVVGIFAIRSGLKAVFPKLAIFNFIRYSLIGLWAFYFYPLLGAKVGLFEAGRS